MFNDNKTAKKHLTAWFKKMGFTGKVVINEYRRLIPGTFRDRPVLYFVALSPYGVFFVFNDNGDVEDNYGYFGDANEIYDADGNRCEKQ